MNYYGSYTASRKKKTARRIIIVVVSVIIIFVVTVIFGNYLKKKAEDNGSHSYGGIGREDLYTETEEQAIIPPSEDGAGSSESVQGVCVPLRLPQKNIGEDEDTNDIDQANDDDSFEARLVLAAEGNTGVLIPLTGDDGLLLYNSFRASSISRLPNNPAIPSMDDLSAAVSAAKGYGLRVTAYIASGVKFGSSEAEYENAMDADSIIVADAVEAGFDEIIIGSLVSSPDDITGDASHVILKYLNQLTAVAGEVSVGLALPPEIYETPSLSPQIELFISRSVFLAMEFSELKSTVEHLNYICENFVGTLSVYNMRILISPKDTVLGEKLTDKLTAIGHMNYLYTNVPIESEQNEPQDTSTETEVVTDEAVVTQ